MAKVVRHARGRKKREHNLRHRYGKHGYRDGDYDRMFREQNGRCAICGTDTPGGRGAFHIDHCHDTGQIRGLLCRACNSAIAWLKDSPELLRRAAEYVERQGVMA